MFEQGGFDVVIGNPPYVRQELLTPYKPYLQNVYESFHGMADLYVYFYELGIRVLKPGGLLSFIVTNKWMKAGYGEALRRFFSEKAWVESVVDFGHAKQIFEEADVFPSIIVARRPDKKPNSKSVRVCAIPREQLQVHDLSSQIDQEGFTVERRRFGSGAWLLEPPGVEELIEKICRTGVPLREYVGISPYRGVTTGLNKAFLIDTPTYKRLIEADPRSGEIIKPYLRGQDITRWTPNFAGEWMIFARRGIDIEAYPEVKRHLQKYRRELEPKPQDWQGDKWLGRKGGLYKWYELQDPITFYEEFETPKIYYQQIQFYPNYAFDKSYMYGNDKTSFITSEDMYLLGVLNSPLLWWYNWRYLPHMKDEALAPRGYRVENIPIVRPTDLIRNQIEVAAERLVEITQAQKEIRRGSLDWLRVEHAVGKPSKKLQTLMKLDSDAFVAEVKRLRGKKNPLSVAALRSLRDEYTRTIEPARIQAVEALNLERQISDLVNEAYGLTPDEVALMWKTAPPRMPIPQPE